MVSPLASLETANGLIRIEAGDSVAQRLLAIRPAAELGGRLGHGRVRPLGHLQRQNKQGQKITQRMRWIEPGPFLMGRRRTSRSVRMTKAPSIR